MCMCIPKIHHCWPALISASLHTPFPPRNIAEEAGHGTKQLVNKASNGEELPRAVESKPLRQSTSNFGSDPDTPRRITTLKESARFGLVRPVDAHFRSALSEAPAPNRCKPPRPIRRAGSQGPPLHRTSVSIRLSHPLARHTAPNFASAAPFVQSATDRRQLTPASRKFGFRPNIEGSSQQKDPELSRSSQPSTPQPHTPAEGKCLHDQFRGEFHRPD